MGNKSEIVKKIWELRRQQGTCKRLINIKVGPILRKSIQTKIHPDIVNTRCWIYNYHAKRSLGIYSW